MYVSMVSSAHAVCAKGLFIAIVSTTVVTKDPEKEIQPAIDFLGGCLNVLNTFSDLHEPINDPHADNLWVTSSYDATSHFETASVDVLSIYERLTGEKLDLNIHPSEEEDY